MDTNTLRGLVNILIHDIYEVISDLSLEALNFLIVLSLVEFRAGHGIFEARGTELDTHGALDGLVVNVLALDSHLTHRLWSQQSSDGGNNGPVETCKDYSVAHIEATVYKDDIDGGTMALDDLDFQD